MIAPTCLSRSLCFVRDVKQMIVDSRTAGTRFTMSTLPWLDGSELEKPNEPRYVNIIGQLNSTFWPLRSADLRRLIELQNRVLRRLADAQAVPLLDVADLYPRDPDLSLDLYHHNLDGIRLHAWIALQQFLPILQHDLEHGLLSSIQADSREPTRPTDLRSFVVHPQCGPTEQMLSRARIIQARTITQLDPKAVLKGSGAVLTVRSSPQPWAYAGSFDLNANCLTGGGWVTLDARLLQGTAAVGVLNQHEDDFVTREVLHRTDGTGNILLKIRSFAQTGALIVQNASESSVSEIEIGDVRLVSDGDGPLPVCPIYGRLANSDSTSSQVAQFAGAQIVPGAADIGGLVANTPNALLRQASGAVTVVPPTQQWAYGAMLPLRLPTETVKRGWVRVEAEVQAGKVGFGLLDLEQNAFVTRVFSGPTQGIISIILPMPNRHAALSLVVQNAAPTPGISKAVIQAVDVLAHN